VNLLVRGELTCKELPGPRGKAQSGHEPKYSNINISGTFLPLTFPLCAGQAGKTQGNAIIIALISSICGQKAVMKKVKKLVNVIFR
jgi:hypothetical protein